MSNQNIFSNKTGQTSQTVMPTTMDEENDFIQTLPVLITKKASKQTYYTIRFLVDRDRILNAYRAYAYFRWVDDSLDDKLATRPERIDFLERQQMLMNCFYQGEQLSDLSDEEGILQELIRNDQEPDSGLQSYIRNMMTVMAFDADRRGRLISQHELSEYTRHLSIAVTEALHYFIGHDNVAPRTPTRYLAVTGAHIIHMLRDTFEDVAAGYFNIPCEFLNSYGINPCDVNSDTYRPWVKNRVQLARVCFKAGKNEMAQIKNLRTRIAGYAYTARFELVLNTIEKEDYQLRPAYPERKSLRAGLKMSQSILSMMLKEQIRGSA